MEDRLVFGCTIYREGPRQLTALLASIREHYPSQHIFVISDGIQNAKYPKICTLFGAEYIQGERLKVLDKGGGWWNRHFKKAAAFQFDYFFKIDPDTRIHRKFNFFPSYDFFGCKEWTNIQGGIQGFRRSAVDKILGSGLLDSALLQNPETWATTAVAQAYVRESGQISTDYMMMYIIHRLKISWGNWEEVDSQWHPVRPFRKDAAATHPHKR
jgi:hypothetical protein